MHDAVAVATLTLEEYGTDRPTDGQTPNPCFALTATGVQERPKAILRGARAIVGRTEFVDDLAAADRRCRHSAVNSRLDRVRRLRMCRRQHHRILVSAPACRRRPDDVT